MNLDSGQIDRLRRAFAQRCENAQATQDCPRPELLWAAPQGELKPAEVAEIVEHIAVCPACAEAWRLARHLGAETAPEAEPEVPRSAVWPGRRALPVAALAAMAALLVLGVVGVELRRQQDVPPGSGYRDGEGAEIRSLLPAAVPLKRQDCWLRWAAPQGEGWRFDLWLMTRELDLLHEAHGLEVSQYRVPEEALAGLPPQSLVRWRVEATLPDGSTLSAIFDSPLE